MNYKLILKTIIVMIVILLCAKYYYRQGYNHGYKIGYMRASVKCRAFIPYKEYSHAEDRNEHHNFNINGFEPFQIIIDTTKP